MRYLSLLLIMLAASCGSIQKPISSQISQNNKDYKVEYLFEHDGCKVYRFYDNGRYIYFTNCNGETIARTDSTTDKNMTHVTK